MEDIQDWAAQLLGNHAALQTYTPYLRQFYSIVTTAQSYIYPLIDKITHKPDIATIALLLVILFISLKLLDLLWQTVLFWLRLARRVVFWGGLVMLGLWLYTRGPEGVWADVQYWVDVWGQEKEYWKDKDRIARMARQGGKMKGGAGSWF
ncbi:hypothetical protein BDY17DRAFT_292329 [Neohortaea acidophila]|uniref:Nuclear pore assembly and biogenesis-domain-containing protein n=1 Tax=Neohortaea acidophila TaxID=245834 RepID=A0A6A6Q332_9PEZI|nr:uncharacterized protein BDY17DRAFT_292329 [Neohortaea acidophila]KAF2486908.1 hypothetical protein BDY17DRAFT_292329 [Neohortaea acidophila]